MALEGVPWMVTGASHSADIGRMLAYAATNGATGIAGLSDLKVTATATASSNVAVAPGGATLLNLYPSGSGQSYTLRNQTQTLVPVSASPAGSTLIRYLIAYIEDPQYGGAAPASTLNGPYVKLSLVSTLSNILYPHIPLARIEQPPSTATITSAMIFDIRKMAQSRIERKMVTVYPTGNRAAGHPIPTASYSSWPITSAQRPTIDVPSWATRLNVVGHFSGVWFTAPDTLDSVAGIRVGFGTEGAENGIIIENKNNSRNHYTVVGTHPVSSDKRGTSQLLNLQGLRSGGTGMWYADYQTSIMIDYQFTEEPS